MPEPTLDDCSQRGPATVHPHDGPKPHQSCTVSGRGRPGTHAGGGTAAQEEAPEQLHAELAQLRRAMETRPVIDQAMGVLMATFRLPADAAWEVMVMTSQNTNTKVYRLAGDLVGSVQGTPLSPTVKKQLTLAVSRSRAAR